MSNKSAVLLLTKETPRCKIAEHILYLGDKDLTIRTVLISPAVCHSSISFCSKEKTAVFHPAERAIACQLLSTEQSSNARAKRRAGGDCLRHCPPRQSSVGGFVGGGISPSPLALAAASTASSQYLSTYSASPPAWTTSFNWLSLCKQRQLNSPLPSVPTN